MSAGTFSREIYESDAGTFHNIRVQPETLTFALGANTNEGGAGPVDSPMSAKVSNGNRAYGLKPRSVTVVFEANQPAGYKLNSPIRVPILKPDLYNAIVTGNSVSYLGSTATVIGKSPERVR